MCGRFTLTIDPGDLQVAWGFGEVPADWVPRYNIAPTQPVAALRNFSAPRLEFLRWGLVPYWAKDPSIGSRMINARAETLQEKPAFRQALARRRCLILADGFYEWQKIPGQKSSRPHLFTLADRQPFGFAGLWETWKDPQGHILESCTIITCAANELVKPVHERMPVILMPAAAREWVGEPGAQDPAAYLRPFPADKMTVRPVGTMVNNPGVDSPLCIQPS